LESDPTAGNYNVPIINKKIHQTVPVLYNKKLFIFQFSGSVEEKSEHFDCLRGVNK
jgi:hypothetical protein